MASSILLFNKTPVHDATGDHKRECNISQAQQLYNLMLPANPVVFQRNSDAFVGRQDTSREIAGRALGSHHSGIDVLASVAVGGIRF